MGWPAILEPVSEIQRRFSLWFCKGDASLPPGAYPGLAQGLGARDVIEVEGSRAALFTNPGGRRSGPQNRKRR